MADIYKGQILEYMDAGSIPNLKLKNTKLLLNFNGINGSKYTTDVFGNPVTFVGDAQISTAQSAFGGSSLLLDGYGDYISIPKSDDWYFGTEDFTIDFRIRFVALPGAGTAGNVYSQYQDDNNYIRFYCGGGESWVLLVVVGGSATIVVNVAATLAINNWYHIAITKKSNVYRIFQDGIKLNSDTTNSEPMPNLNASLLIGSNNGGAFINGYIDDFRVVKGEALWTENFTVPSTEAAIDFNEDFNRFKVLLNQSVTAGTTFSKPIVSTYPLVAVSTTAYRGGVLSANGDIHFVPLFIGVGQKVSLNGIVSTYSLVYTGEDVYVGGALSPNGDIHFAPYYAQMGQKVSASGVVSTYSLVYTVAGAYVGAVTASNGDIHFVPCNATVGQKISASGVVSTYSLLYTKTGAYAGGVLDSYGNIHFTPYGSTIGQKISASGVLSTYSFLHTINNAYIGGALSPNGDIHFAPYSSGVGQKVSASGVVSTYSLVYAAGGANYGAVTAPNGDIHFVPFNAAVGQKVSASGVVSTYSLVYTRTGAYAGGVLLPNGDIHLIPMRAGYGQIIHTNSAKSFGFGICLSSYFNKL